MVRHSEVVRIATTSIDISEMRTGPKTTQQAAEWFCMRCVDRACVLHCLVGDSRGSFESASAVGHTLGWDPFVQYRRLSKAIRPMIISRSLHNLTLTFLLLRRGISCALLLTARVAGPENTLLAVVPLTYTASHIFHRACGVRHRMPTTMGLPPVFLSSSAFSLGDKTFHT